MQLGVVQAPVMLSIGPLSRPNAVNRNLARLTSLLLSLKCMSARFFDRKTSTSARPAGLLRKHGPFGASMLLTVIRENLAANRQLRFGNVKSGR